MLKITKFMNVEEKLELNKLIRQYDGDNTFIVSLKSQLKYNRYLDKIKVGNRNYKILSDRQYESAKSILEV